MRSPISAAAAERAARAIVLGSLAALLWREWSPPQQARTEVQAGDEPSAALASWSLDPVPQRIDLSITRVPGPVERDWLRALVRSGRAVLWSGDLPPLGVEVVTTAEPRPWYVVRVAHPADPVRLEDAAREIARADAAGGLTTIRTSSLVGPVGASGGGSTALALAPPPQGLRRVAVIGSAGWEAKFVVAALEESGWNVDSRIIAAPGVSVGTIAPSDLDTARFAAAVVLDPPSREWFASVARFVSSGGGLVITARAAAMRELSALAGARISGSSPLSDTTVIERGSLGARVLTPASHAVPLERRGRDVTVAGARYGSGRAVLSGYEDTWRWRMQGGERSLENHRDWWSALVGGVAHARYAAGQPSPEAAPVAAWVDALGPAADEAHATDRVRALPWSALLLALMAAALLFEIVSRRRRGLP